MLQHYYEEHQPEKVVALVNTIRDFSNESIVTKLSQLELPVHTIGVTGCRTTILSNYYTGPSTVPCRENPFPTHMLSFAYAPHQRPLSMCHPC